MDSLKDIAADQFEQDTEQWKIDHDEAMDCCDVDELLEIGLRIYRVIRGADEHWSKRVQEGAIAFDAKRLKELHEMYRQWLGPVDQMLELIEYFLQERYTLNNANEFVDAARTAKAATQWSADELIAARDAVRSGKCVALEEVLGGLEGESQP